MFSTINLKNALKNSFSVKPILTLWSETDKKLNAKCILRNSAKFL